MNWEIRTSVQLGKRVLAVNLRTESVRVPAALVEIGVKPLAWEAAAIVEELKGQGHR